MTAISPSTAPQEPHYRAGDNCMYAFSGEFRIQAERESDDYMVDHQDPLSIAVGLRYSILTWVFKYLNEILIKRELVSTKR